MSEHITSNEGYNSPQNTHTQLEHARDRSKAVRRERMKERQQPFIETLNRCNGVIASAMREEGAPKWRTLTRWRREQPEFEDLVQQSIASCMERLHEVAVRLASGDAHNEPDTNMLRFVLSHCSDLYKKNSEPMKIELSVERKRESVQDLKRLLSQQENKFVESTAKNLNSDKGVGGTVIPSDSGMVAPETTTFLKPLEEKDDSP